jgi:hypothetical protein
LHAQGPFRELPLCRFPAHLFVHTFPVQA